MAEGNTLVAICQYGGEFVTNSDGSMFYYGGEAHAVDVNRETLLDDLKSEITSVFGIDLSGMSMKYFLPNNRRTLISISSDKDLQRMVEFNLNVRNTEVYIVNKVDNRATRSTVADSGTSVIAVSDTGCGVRRKRVTNGGRMTRSRTRLDEASNLLASTNAAMNTVVEKEHIEDEKVDLRPIVANMGPPAVVAAANAVNVKDWRLTVGDQLDETATGNIQAEPSTPLFASLTTLDDVRPVNSNPVFGTTITGVGQEFDNVKDFRAQLCRYGLEKGFIYRFIKNETSRVTARCIGENCPWRIYASESSRKQKFIIKKMNHLHTCGGGNGKDGNRRASRQWLTGFIKEKLHESLQCKPKEIVKELYDIFGVNVSYSQVWRGREVAQREYINTIKETHNQLPWFCGRILETNPGSAVFHITSPDYKFQRFFVAFNASLHGFEHGCRPLLFLDRISLRSNTQYKLLSAVAVDGDDAVFPVAFALVEDESYNSWLWFLEHLRYALPTTTGSITFVSNRQKGLEEAIPQVFVDCHHCYCLHHLMEEFKEELKKGMWPQQVKDAMANDFTRAAQACTIDEFNSCIQNIRNISTDVADWVIASKPENWSDALFKGSRYDHFATNIMDSLNSWIPLKHESTIVQIVNSILCKLLEVMQLRKEVSSTWCSILTPATEQKLEKEIANARKLDVLCSSESVFEVRGNMVHVVNTGSWECTCRRWQVSGLPCMHAIAALNKIGRSVYDYCSKYFRADVYQMMYSVCVQPIPDIETVDTIDFAGEGNLFPMPVRRPPGRPRRKRINPNKPVTMQRLCSKCKEAGHNKATCEALL
ncbi:uncharacterized protein LOC120280548 [Dioscorea cayenensis subsp. rotundata]|uniref:Uncharacterized protein LOC120280548 n=1 Tax=Dioscorea cayennensis subsp. rotundata TaxID=55577 RepID=A0AB40CVD3_DIOCR|nr:uncharacterized protein LOC120280548 [Dioscorea cayenensis subsp. rotundata]